MPRYLVITRLRRDGKVIKPGRPVDLTEEEAKPLLVCGAVASAKDGEEDTERDDLVAAIRALPKDNDKAWLKDGRPDTKALADLIGRPVGAAERDAAWAAFQAERT